ncbi:unnamed protein product [Prunus armeniaca]
MEGSDGRSGVPKSSLSSDNDKVPKASLCQILTGVPKASLSSDDGRVPKVMTGCRRHRLSNDDGVPKASLSSCRKSLPMFIADG